MATNSDLWKKYIDTDSNDFDVEKFIEIGVDKEINFDPSPIKYYLFQEIINENYTDLLKIMNEPYEYRFYPDSLSNDDLNDYIEAEGLTKHDVVSQIDKLNTLTINCHQPGHKHRYKCIENIDLLKRLNDIYLRFPAIINVYPINYGSDLFNEIEEKYLYHGTKSTNEVITSNYLESNKAHGAYEKKIFFGRTFDVSYNYANPMGETTNVKSVDITKRVHSVLIMDKLYGYDFEKINMGSLGIESYVLKENQYSLLDSLRAIVFLTKNDLNNFLKKFDTFTEDMKKKLKEIMIFQFDYYPVKLKERIGQEIQANFFTKYFKTEIIRKFILDYNASFKDDTDAKIKMISYFTNRCMDEKKFEILCILSTFAVDCEILPEFIDFINSKITIYVDMVLYTVYNTVYTNTFKNYNKTIGEILAKLTEEKEKLNLDGRNFRKKQRYGKKKTKSRQKKRSKKRSKRSKKTQ